MVATLKEYHEFYKDEFFNKIFTLNFLSGYTFSPRNVKVKTNQVFGDMTYKAGDRYTANMEYSDDCWELVEKSTNTVENKGKSTVHVGSGCSSVSAILPPILPINSYKCSCKSSDLFNFGCKCGYLEKTHG